MSSPNVARCRQVSRKQTYVHPHRRLRTGLLCREVQRDIGKLHGRRYRYNWTPKVARESSTRDGCDLALQAVFAMGTRVRRIPVLDTKSCHPGR